MHDLAATFGRDATGGRGGGGGASSFGDETSAGTRRTPRGTRRRVGLLLPSSFAPHHERRSACSPNRDATRDARGAVPGPVAPVPASGDAGDGVCARASRRSSPCSRRPSWLERRAEGVWTESATTATRTREDASPERRRGAAGDPGRARIRSSSMVRRTTRRPLPQTRCSTPSRWTAAGSPPRRVRARRSPFTREPLEKRASAEAASETNGGGTRVWRSRRERSFRRERSRHELGLGLATRTSRTRIRRGLLARCVRRKKTGVTSPARRRPSRFARAARG